MITYQEIQALIAKQWPNADVIVLDGEYALLDWEWIKGEFARDMAHNLQLLGLQTWIEERNDCDKFSRWTWGFLSLLHARASTDLAGPAFGIIDYVPDWAKGGGHSINCGAFRNADGSLGIRCYEPQRCFTGDVEVVFSPAENASVMTVII